jgi:hypothetical protein
VPILTPNFQTEEERRSYEGVGQERGWCIGLFNNPEELVAQKMSTFVRTEQQDNCSGLQGRVLEGWKN